MVSNKRANLSPRNIQLILISCLLVIMGFYIVSTTLFLPSTFEDDRYNLGVALRSASPEAKSLLETSLTHWYFKFYPTPRPEDWHRGLSVLALSFWARLTGSNSVLMRIPHLLWVALWLCIACFLCLRLTKGTGKPFSRTTRLWITFCLLAFLTVNAPGLLVFSRAYLDDIPAAVIILLALFLLINVEVLSWRMVAIIGALCGLSFFVKNFYFIWGPIGVLLVVVLSIGKLNIKALLKALRLSAVFTLAFFIVVIPKFVWNWHDFGELLEAPARCAIGVGAYLAPELEDYPFFLDQKQPCDQLTMPADQTHVGISQTNLTFINAANIVQSIRFLAYTWLWIPPIIIARRHFQNPIHRKLLLCLFLSIATYMVAFKLGLSLPSETRYWLVPITLTMIAGIYGAFAMYRSVKRWRQAMAITFGFMIFAAGWSAVDQVATAFDLTPLTNYSMLTDRMASAVRPEESAMLQTRDAIYYWSLHPLSRVTSFEDDLIASMDASSIRRFMDAYNVQWALYTAPAASRLEQLGFVEVSRGGGYRLLHRQPEPDNPAIF